MSISRQQRRYLDRQQAKAARRKKIPSDGGGPPTGFLGRTKTIFAILASIGTIATAAYAYLPSLEIVALPWESSTGPGDARFQFKNSGRLAIKDVRFDCEIHNASNLAGIKTSGVSLGQGLTGKKSQLIGDLAPGQIVSRTCFGGPGGYFVGAHPSNIAISASFVWPYLGFRSEMPTYFVSETDGKRTWMTPEKPPTTAK